MTDLVIVESGAKGKKIKQILGKGFIVETCKGHVQDLPGPGCPDKKQKNKAMWASKKDSLPEPLWDWSGRNSKERTSTEKLVNSILSKAEKHDVQTVYLATDPDREGEFIAWRLEHIFNQYNTVRISFNEITKNAVLAAIDSPRDIDMDLVDAAKVRRFMDRLVGFRASKFSRSWRLPSMGRVQTPTLGFIVEREAERDAFVPQPFYAVTSVAEDISFKVRFHEKDDKDAWFDHDHQPPKHHADRTNDQNLAMLAIDSIKSSRKLTLTQVKSGTRSVKPNAPFMTSTLITAAGNHPRMGWGNKRIASVASSLYEEGHITYTRTDSTRTNPDARDNIREFISDKWGSDHLRDTPGIGNEGTVSKNVQDAHEAIRPTDPSNMNPEGLDESQMLLYRLIWSRFAASQMSNSEYENLSLRASVKGLDCPLTGSISWRVHAGWEAAFGDLIKEKRVHPPPPLSVDNELDVADEENGGWKLTEDETKPPPRYNQSSLVTKMEDEGIGRPSTYATTVDKLLDKKRKYIFQEAKALIPSIDGKTLWDEVAPMFGDDKVRRGVFESDFTATMESSLDSIEHGSAEATEVWSNFVDDFTNAHSIALEIRSLKPTVKQLAYMESLLNAIPPEEREKLLNGKQPSEISGERTKEIIEHLKSQNVVGAASERQLKLINKLVEETDSNIDEILATISVNSIDELTGGRNGTASLIIGKLFEIQGQVPKAPSARQIKYVKDLIKKAEIEEEEYCQNYNIKSVDEMTAAQASDSIQKLQDKLGIKGRGRRRR